MANQGRPTDYTIEIDKEICRRLMDGESLRNICLDEHMPSKTTVFNWLADSDFNKETGFLDHYELARAIQAESLADDLVDIADDGRNDWMERNGEDNPGWVYNGEHVQRSRLRVDVRKWIASKLKPKKYGEKVDITTGGKPLPLLGGITRDTDNNGDQETGGAKETD